MRKKLIIIVLISALVNTYGQQDHGCFIEDTKSNGICKNLEECPSVIQSIKHNVSYTRCGFAGKTEIVCCPQIIPATTSNPPQENSSSRISQRKCEEFKLLARQCPLKAKILIPIVVPGEFPHMALIGFDSFSENVEWLCSGTLISDEYVLTAAHCTNTRHLGNPTVVRLGEHNFSSEDGTQPEDYNISAIFAHPDYNNRINYNDIALLKLDRKVNLSPDKRPACLPTEFDTNEANLMSTGWCTNLGPGTRLVKVDLNHLPLGECNATYASNVRRRMMDGITPTQLCAELREKEACPDDSGGPLQINHPEHDCMYTVIGVQSLSIHSAAGPKTTEVYTRIFPYLDWIESIVWKHNS